MLFLIYANMILYFIFILQTCNTSNYVVVSGSISSSLIETASMAYSSMVKMST